MLNPTLARSKSLIWRRISGIITGNSVQCDIKPAIRPFSSFSSCNVHFQGSKTAIWSPVRPWNSSGPGSSVGSRPVPPQVAPISQILSLSHILTSRSYSSRIKPGIISFFVESLPTPVKSLIPIVGISALLFFVAAPLLLIFLPPVLLGAMLYARRLRRKQQKLFEKRWNEMASYHLTYQSESAALNEQETLKKICMRRIISALQDNEQNIDVILRASNDVPSSLNQLQFSLGDVEMIQDDWRVGNQGLSQGITVYTMGLIDKAQEKKVANVDLVVKSSDVRAQDGSTRPSKNKSVRIEITEVGGLRGLRPRTFVLDSPADDDVVIDIKPRKGR